MKGVSKVDMDFKTGLFTLAVADGTVITPTQVRKAVRARFKIPSIEVVDLTGSVHKSKRGDTSMAIGGRSRVALTDGKGKNVVAKLQDGQAVKISGALLESGEKGNKRLTIQVTKAEEIQGKTKRTS